jgi:anti-anti-sigma factor
MIERMDSVKVICPTGVFDGTKVDEFHAAIQTALDSGAKTFLIDLKEVTFMDSTGLGVLITGLKTVQSADGQMYLCSPNDQIKILFDLTSMDELFQIFADATEFARRSPQ